MRNVLSSTVLGLDAGAGDGVTTTRGGAGAMGGGAGGGGARTGGATGGGAMTGAGAGAGTGAGAGNGVAWAKTVRGKAKSAATAREIGRFRITVAGLFRWPARCSSLMAVL
jgi:hypothetical protein